MNDVDDWEEINILVQLSNVKSGLLLGTIQLIPSRSVGGADDKAMHQGNRNAQVVMDKMVICVMTCTLRCAPIFPLILKKFRPGNDDIRLSNVSGDAGAAETVERTWIISGEHTSVEDG